MTSRSKSCFVVFALLILWTASGLAQEEEPIEVRIERLEEQLPDARGRERVEFLVELAELADTNRRRLGDPS